MGECKAKHLLTKEKLLKGREGGARFSTFSLRKETQKSLVSGDTADEISHYLCFKSSEEAKMCPNDCRLPRNSSPYADMKKETEFSSGYYSQGE